MYLIIIFIYHIKYNYANLRSIHFTRRMTSIFRDFLDYIQILTMFVNNFTVNIEACRTNLSENNVTRICLISRINDIHIIKPPSINL